MKTASLSILSKYKVAFEMSGGQRVSLQIMAKSSRDALRMSIKHAPVSVSFIEVIPS